MVSDVLEYVDTFKGKSSTFNCHQEDNKLFNKKIVSNKQVFANVFQDLGNSFPQEWDQLVHIKTTQLPSNKLVQ